MKHRRFRAFVVTCSCTEFDMRGNSGGEAYHITIDWILDFS